MLLLLLFANGVKAQTTSEYGFYLSYLNYNYGAWYQNGVTWSTENIPLLGYTDAFDDTSESTTGFHQVLSNIKSLTINYTTTDENLQLQVNGTNSQGTSTMSDKVTLDAGTNVEKIITFSSDLSNIGSDETNIIVNCFISGNSSTTINSAYYTIGGNTVPVMYSTNSTYANMVKNYAVPSSTNPLTIFVTQRYQGVRLCKGSYNSYATITKGTTNLYHFELDEANSNFCLQTNLKASSDSTVRYNFNNDTSIYQTAKAWDENRNVLTLRDLSPNIKYTSSGNTYNDGINTFDYITIKGITVYEGYGGDLALKETATDNTTSIGSDNTIYYGTTITRPLTKENWAGIVLPYDLTSDEIETYFGSGAKVATFSDVTTGTDGDVTFNFSTTTDTIAAGTPFLVYPTVEVTDTLPIKYTTLINSVTETTINGYTFTGTYDYKTLPSGSIYVASGNVFKIADGTGSINGFRAYFTTTTSAKSIQLSIDNNNISTGIEGISTDATSSDSYKVYNLNGQYVGDSLDGLTSGVYIQNGKKVVVK